MSVRKDSIQISVDIEASQGVKAYQTLLDETKKVNAQMRKLKKSGQEGGEEFKKLSKRAGELNDEMNKLGGANANMGQLIGRAGQLNREIKSLVPGTKRFIQATTELKKVNTRLAEIRKETRGVTNAMNNAKGAGTGMGGSIGKGINSIGTAFKGLVALQIISWFVDLFKMVDETTKQFVKLRGGIEQFSQATGTQLDDYTVKVSAISTTFKKESEEVLQATNSLAKQMGISFSDALGLVEKGFIAGADRNGEFLDSLKEYPTFFREMELSGEQMISVITQSVNEGIFSDKGPDLIKEFNIRVREMPKATKAAFDAIGLSSKQIENEITTNGIGGAFTLVQSQLNKLEDDSPAVGQALADIFGGAGEDAGIQFIKSLELTNESLEELSNNSSIYTTQLRNQLIANEELADAQNEVAKQFTATSGSLQIYVTKVKTFLFNSAGLILGFFEQLPATFKGVQAAFTQVFDNIKNFFESTYISLQISYKKITKLNPFGKTSEEIDKEISKLRGQQNALADSASSVIGAYNSAMLDELDTIDQRKKVAEALMPPLDDQTVSKAVARDVKQVGKAYDAELAKMKAERANAPGAVTQLETSAPSQVSSTGEAEIDTSSQDELLKNKFLQAIISEQEYEEQRFQLMQNAYTRRLEFLKEKFGEESAAFVALENEKLMAQESHEQQRQELAKRTEDVRYQLQQQGVNALSDIVGSTIKLLQGEEKARKKNATAIKAFSIGKVLIDTQEAIVSIIKNAESNPGNILFPAAGAIIAGIKIAGVVAKSGIAVNRIRKQGFYDGGFTGSEGLFNDDNGRKVVGAVHENEWVAPQWMTSHPKSAPIIGMLEQMRTKGFVEGGFTTPTTSSSAEGSAQDFSFLQKTIGNLADSQMQMVTAIQGKQFQVTTGQLRSALEEDYLLDEKTSF